MDAEAAVLVADPDAPRGACCGTRSTATASASTFADMEELGRNPGRIIGAWRDFVRAHAGGRRRRRWASASRSGPGAREAELVECQRHETLLNLAFTTETPWTLLCPYDAERLPHDVLDAARRNHPHVSSTASSHRSEAYARRDPGPRAAAGAGRRAD